MKRLSTTIVCLACFFTLQAAPGPGPKTNAAVLKNDALVNTGAARFQFKNLIAGLEENDSILIIFDRYDHAGAGIVYKVFAPDSEHGITVPAIAAGKYYVTVQCLGLHRDRLEKIVTIRSQRNEMIRIQLTPSEAFSRSKVIIPVFHPNPQALAVVQFKQAL